MDTDLVSVIMPAFNAEKYIQESINSVIAQTYTNWELIVVDDGSTDNTSVIIKNIQLTDKRIQYHYQKNANQASARNAALQMANGSLIAFLDADDTWLGNKLEKQVEVFKNNASVGLVFSGGYYLFQGTHTSEPYDTLVHECQGAGLYNQLILHNSIPALSVCFKRELIAVTGILDKKTIAKGCEDWDYWLRLSQTGVIFWGLKERLFNYRVHVAGTSANTLKMRIAGVYVVAQNLNKSWATPDNYKQLKHSLASSLPMLLKAMINTGSFALITELATLVVKITLTAGRLIPALALKRLKITN